MSANEIRSVLAAAAHGLNGSEGRLEAEVLLAHALGKPRAWLYAHGDDALGIEAAQRFHELVARRIAGETGRWPI